MSARTATAPVEIHKDFVHWTPVIAGALVASAMSLVLLTFGAAIGLSVASTAATWRDASATLAVASGLFLLLAAIVSFGFGGYIAGRLRETWNTTLHTNFTEFRDGTHGLLSWALAVAITAVLASAIPSVVTSKSAPAPTPATSTAEAVIAYDLDRLFRSDRRDQGDLAYHRAEAGRILLNASGRTGITAEDRGYLTRLVMSRTGIAQPEAERRVDDAISAATLAIKKARQSAAILAFSIAASLLAGAAVAWFAACLGGQHRDQAAPPLRWNWSRS